MLLAIVLASNAPFASPPVADSSQASQWEEGLKQRCMSPAGVRLTVRHLQSQDSIDRDQEQVLERLNAELLAATTTDPLDLGRLQRAAEARDHHRYEMDRRQTGAALALMRQLSPRDRAILLQELDFNLPKPPRPPVIVAAPRSDPCRNSK